MICNRLLKTRIDNHGSCFESYEIEQIKIEKIVERLFESEDEDFIM